MIRAAKRNDLSAAVELMRAHAAQEDYIETFAVTADLLSERLFGDATPYLRMMVHQSAHMPITGLALYSLIPFSFTEKPILHLNDLIVAEEVRRQGIGVLLFQAICEEAVRLDCFKLRWFVSEKNTEAKAFYARMGGVHEPAVQHYSLDQAKLATLRQRMT